MNLIVSHEHPLRTNQTRSARREIKHVALPKQTIRSVLIEDNATVDLRRDLECDSGRNVRLDYAGDHIRARSLRCDDDMNTCRTCHLCDARDRRLDVRRSGLHQISQLVDDDHHVRKSIGNDQLILPRYFYWAVFRLTRLYGLHLFLFHRTCIEADDVSHAYTGEDFVAALHLVDQPPQG